MARSGYVKLAKIIKAERKSMGMSQANLAKAIGVDSSEFISMIETGKRVLELEKIPTMARALRQNVENFSKLALMETYPVFYEVLYGKSVPEVKPLSGSEMETFQVPLEIYGFFTQFNALPNDFQQSIRNIVRHHYRLQLKAGRSSEIPQR